MKTLGNFTKFSFAAVGCGLFFTACGDDVTKVTNVTNENSGMEIAKSADSLGTCDSVSVGKMMFASDENAVYICADSGWTPLSEKAADGKDGVDGLDGASCTVKALSDGDGYKVICGDDSVGVILNGSNGKDGIDGKDGNNGLDGKDGVNGLDGTSCTAAALSDSSGYRIMCGEDSVGVILNGSNGKDGKNGLNGTNGTSCTVAALSDGSGYKVVCGENTVGVILNGLDGNGCAITDNGDGTLSQVCGADSVTLYKALCGSVPYDPAKMFCFEEKTYEYCASASYDPTKQFCLDGNLYIFCNGESYDATEKFCYDDSPYALCGGKSYDVMTEYCDGGTVYEGKGQFTDARDGKTYKTVMIGTQVWMAENLNYDYNRNTAKSYCYNGNADSCAKYGRLYTWAAAMDSAAKFSETGETCGYGKTCYSARRVRGVCPEGWHLPDTTEWGSLKKSVADSLFDGDISDAGYALKSKSGWFNGGNGSDAFGFGALPAGRLNDEGKFDKVLTTASFWSSTEYFANSAYLVELNYDKTTLDTYNYYKKLARSVRCVKD